MGRVCGWRRQRFPWIVKHQGDVSVVIVCKDMFGKGLHVQTGMFRWGKIYRGAPRPNSLRYRACTNSLMLLR